MTSNRENQITRIPECEIRAHHYILAQTHGFTRFLMDLGFKNRRGSFHSIPFQFACTLFCQFECLSGRLRLRQLKIISTKRLGIIPNLQSVYSCFSLGLNSIFSLLVVFLDTAYTVQCTSTMQYNAFTSTRHQEQRDASASSTRRYEMNNRQRIGEDNTVHTRVVNIQY